MSDLVYDFTSLDFDAVVEDIVRFAKTIYTEEEWTDFNASDEGVRLIQLMGYATDLLAYNSNAQFLETMVSTLIRERNFLTIADWNGYQLKRESPAKTVLEFTCDSAFFPISLPKTFKVADRSGAVVFEPDSDAVITTTTFLIDATQGETVSSETLGISDGTARQRYFLQNKPLLDDTLVVTVGGIPFTKVRSFAAYSTTSQVFRVVFTEESDAYVEFGDDVNGQIPQVGRVIVASYRFGGGSHGNLPASYISRLVDSIPGIVSVKNVVAAKNGGPKQSLAHAKLQMPAEIRANDRAVTPADYATLAQKVAGVLRAQGVSGRRRGGGNEIILFLVPPDAEEVSASVANEVVRYIQVGDEDGAKGMGGKRVAPRTAVYVNLKMHVEAYAEKGTKASTIEAAISKMFLSDYSPDQSFFGGIISLQNAYVRTKPDAAGIPGLAGVQIKEFSVLPYSARYVNSPTTGNGDVTYVTTNEKVSRREWNIVVSPPTGSTPEFVVTQRILGTVLSISSNSITDDTATFEDNELVGYRLRIDEQLQRETWEIVGNSQRTITVSGYSSPSNVSSLFNVGVTGSSYAVERVESKIGKIFLYDITAASSTVLSLSSVAGITGGSNLVVHRASGLKDIVQVLAVGAGGATNVALTVALNPPPQSGDQVSWWWSSDDSSVGFTLVPGTVPFAVGDELYVDTFAKSGDIRLRPENFPKLVEANLLVTVVGGVK